jgi:hypothetical protein
MSWRVLRPWLARYGGWLLIAIGVGGAVLELEILLGYQTRTPGSNHGPIAGIAIAAGLFVVGAILQLRRRSRGGTAALPGRPDLEPRLLRVAQAKAGRLTASEAALALELPFGEVDDALAALAAKDACRTLVTEDKVVVYYFPEFEDPAAKRRDITER